VIASVVVVAVAMSGPAVQKSPTFAGTWVLDKQASQGLSPATTGADKVIWKIVQDDKTIAVSEEMIGGQRPGSGSLGTYSLDGTESHPETTGGNVVVTLQARWSGPRLELLRKQTVSGSNPVETNASRTLTLAPDGKTLTVTMKYRSARGTSDSTWVFVRQ